ncbi:MAG TPA: FAD-dependent monooxygenase [Pyrinomonadaceae bacterium]|nr:FAD-dependent monooxygenase [Pyrinomonadaceae bacterium]
MKSPSSTAVPGSPQRRERRHALVIGSSMAGMLAARVLSDHFSSVTILERDSLTAETEHRRGIPQAQHLHALLARGLQIIEQLFPGIGEELVHAGAVPLETGSDVAWLTPAGWGKYFQSNLQILSFTRPFLDKYIRRRLVQIENIKIIPDCDVVALVSNSKRNGVSGVTVKLCCEDDSAAGDVRPPQAERFIDADLVVDASGRHSRAPQWLKALGYQAPRETVVNAFIGYATRLYERPAASNASWKAILLQSAPPENPRAGLLFPIEKNRWILTIAGGGRDYPPTDEREFINFIESLRSSLLFDVLRDAKPISPIRSYRNTENRLRHYDEMSSFPGNFVLLGDSVCAFNPVYGQGMTVAAMDAMELDRAVSTWKKESFDAEFGRRFQRKLAKIQKLPWSLATGEDFRYRETEGAKAGFMGHLMHSYIDKLVALTTRDITVRAVWLRVFQMLEPPSRLFQPRILAKVLREIIVPPKREKAGATLRLPRPSWANTSQD